MVTGSHTSRYPIDVGSDDLKWDFTLRHYLSLASIISAVLDKSVHPLMMPWLLLLRRHLFRRA